MTGFELFNFCRTLEAFSNIRKPKDFTGVSSLNIQEPQHSPPSLMYSLPLQFSLHIHSPYVRIEVIEMSNYFHKALWGPQIAILYQCVIEGFPFYQVNFTLLALKCCLKHPASCLVITFISIYLLERQTRHQTSISHDLLPCIYLDFSNSENMKDKKKTLCS